jgi:Uncharacterized protein conserved in archaea
MSPEIPASRAAVLERLTQFDQLLEVGIGARPEVATALAAAGQTVQAIDINERPAELSETVKFSQQSIHELADAADQDRTPPRYYVDVVYAFNLPAELQSATARFASAVAADCLFTTLGFESPVIETVTQMLGRATVHQPQKFATR